ncbi:nitrate ABC transporter substrate-binding protein [Cupriavidus sp. USMAHM13]|uniref:ABC transporter substrate-binding protein n=1 Tax=Cupriavidus sp. USMAHM13 TaxID=1389192 RepID=UPI0008A6D28E|nr:ABC transporter substrate-binding protein [Cupriavidus sp. USMAHM13]AOZ01837.1 nitrate ABC transporter substrate-binding protein [Cupriavidus sp. USMAHM13]
MSKPLTASLACAAALLATVAGGVQAAPEEVTYLLPAPPNLPAFAPWMIAQQKGYYADENIKVTFVAARGGVDVAKQIGAGNAIIGGAIGDTPIIVRANGVPVKAVAVLGAGALTQLAVHQDEGIRSVKDLKGKTVTVMAYADTTYYALLGTLRKAGLGKEDVPVQAAGPAGVWQLFAAKKASAMAGAPEWVVNAAEAGAKVELLPAQDSFKSMAQAILASDEAIRTRPELVRKLVRATLRGMDDIVKDPKAAAQVYAQAVPTFKGKEATVERIFALYRQNVYAGQKPLGIIDGARLEAVQKFYVSEGIVARATPVNELYTNQFVGGR